jgi:hypothetical protein
MKRSEKIINMILKVPKINLSGKGVAKWHCREGGDQQSCQFITAELLVFGKTLK